MEDFEKLKIIIEQGMRTPFWEWLKKTLEQEIKNNFDKAVVERNQKKFNILIAQNEVLRKILNLPYLTLSQIDMHLKNKQRIEQVKNVFTNIFPGVINKAKRILRP